ncbi:MAG TPA: hypothetical protein VH482_37905 [Thermomicrobiales bacterium]|jgi:hypothetical protein
MAIALETPTEVTLYQEDVAAPRFTPRELQEVKAILGRSFTQVISDEDTDDKFAVLAWLKLRRAGHPIAWEEMLDVVIEVRATDAAPLDPMNGSPPTTSPHSAATGE